jgi:hypothetical protein
MSLEIFHKDPKIVKEEDMQGPITREMLLEELERLVKMYEKVSLNCPYKIESGEPLCEIQSLAQTSCRHFCEVTNCPFVQLENTRPPFLTRLSDDVMKIFEIKQLQREFANDPLEVIRRLIQRRKNRSIDDEGNMFTNTEVCVIAGADDILKGTRYFERIDDIDDSPYWGYYMVRGKHCELVIVDQGNGWCRILDVKYRGKLYHIEERGAQKRAEWRASQESATIARSQQTTGGQNDGKT